MASVVLADSVLPRSWQQSATSRLLANVALVVAGSLLTALAARVSLPLPFTPVPITGQTFAVLLVGAVLGSRRGAASMALYVAQGLAGLPVFAGGKAGLAVLLGPTGGYLVGFIAAAFVTGWLAERGWDRQPLATAVAMALGNIAIYLFGVSWLAAFVGIERAPLLGLVPFLPGDALKIVLATLALPGAWWVVRRMNPAAL
ncbi:biotin transporter BioY [Thermomicrobium sp. CFH 73360]|uniref:biotin transporter BioY n=1 Tax=Thermomicrobium sp. CFH 73360 TaxID=2951987 RepID=UPI00207774A6|nr:biotin transporter BioY [Thermomicrobium sp. CFH 73360]MCM8746245.1 biotin transporter BioY [Thermomicrobium sp. CFH 73360]